VTAQGNYVSDDHRSFAIPDGWEPVSAEVLTVARDQTLAALTGPSSVDLLAQYYNRDTAYAGTLFLDVEPNNSFVIEPSDLYAVTTLSMDLDARQGRLLLDVGNTREVVRRQLRGLDPTLPITDLDHGEGGSAETLRRMYELHHTLRTLLAKGSRRWVFAAKLCARKRPRLFPVRDNLVCRYLADGRTLKAGDGWPGDFSVDVQVYAYLATLPQVRSALSWLRAELEEDRGLRVDEENLRLLDSALWMTAKNFGDA
jgi:hypothetical protein